MGGESHIIDAAITDPTDLGSGETIKKVCAIRTGLRWIKTFDDAIYTYGLEILACLATLMAEGDDIRGKTVTFYNDNNNALDSIVKNSATPTTIHASTALIWRRVRDLCISPWFERVPSRRNIDDLHTRYVKIPY